MKARWQRRHTSPDQLSVIPITRCGDFCHCPGHVPLTIFKLKLADGLDGEFRASHWGSIRRADNASERPPEESEPATV
jgi:hypothetical protein